MLSFAYRSRTGLALRRVAIVARRIRSRLEAYRLEQRHRIRMANELSTFSDRELGELGYSRADLIAIARGTYQR